MCIIIIYIIHSVYSKYIHFCHACINIHVLLQTNLGNKITIIFLLL